MGDRSHNRNSDDFSSSRYSRANYGSGSARSRREGSSSYGAHSTWEEPTMRGASESHRSSFSSGERIRSHHSEWDSDRQAKRSSRESSRHVHEHRSHHGGHSSRFAEGATDAYAGDSRNAVGHHRSHRGGSEDAYRQTAQRHQAARPTRARDSRSSAVSRTPARWGKRIALVLLALVLVGGVGIAVYINGISDNLHRGVTQEVRDVLVKTEYSKEPFYMLLMGTDESAERNEQDYGGSFRSDSMMLARIDCPNKKVTLISLERDTLVDMGEHGWQKLNAASAFGGPAYAIEMVSKMAHNVPISHYALIDFDGFCDVVDALGGVDIDVPIEIDDEDAGGYLAPGLQTLTGEQALILCRSRNAYEGYGSGNAYRSANQRLVLSAIAQKILTSDIGTIASTVGTLSNYLSTDLEINDIIGLAQALRGLDMSTDMLTAMQPTTAKYEDATWFNTSDEPEWATMIDRVNQGLSPTEGDLVDSTGTVLATAGSGEKLGGSGANVYLNVKSGLVLVRNGGAPAGSGSRAAAVLGEMGYDTDVANASRDDYAETLVVFSEPSQRQDALQIAQKIGIGKLLLNNGDYRIEGDFLVVLGADYGA